MNQRTWFMFIGAWILRALEHTDENKEYSYVYHYTADDKIVSYEVEPLEIAG